MNPTPRMNDPADKDIHTTEGVDPYPAPTQAEKAGEAGGDEQTSTPENAFERGRDEDGEYRDAVDTMKQTLKDTGEHNAWKKGLTQG